MQNDTRTPAQRAINEADAQASTPSNRHNLPKDFVDRLDTLAQQRAVNEADTAQVVGSMAIDVSNAYAARGAVAPRIDQKDLHEKVARVDFLRPGMALNPYSPSEVDRLTLAFVTLKNGWVIVGQSSCAHIDNYDEAKGRAFAMDDALRQLWPLEGYLLKEQLHQQKASVPSDFYQRLADDLASHGEMMAERGL